MDQFIETFNNVLSAISGVIWSDYTLYGVLAVGVLFTVWSRFCQYRALTHGVQVIRGKYDDKADPGAISHFQALSAALSATVGLGNIGGVAVAITVGGPGAVFWMWIIGFFGMALKTTEVSMAMLYRNTDDPENPHGGAMYVTDKGFSGKGPGWARFGKALGILFCITLLISSITGGNMFQAWNVGEVTSEYFPISKLACGFILSIMCGAVIIGGIKRIGSVAGTLVPFMCGIYLIAGIYVLFVNRAMIPDMFSLIFKSAFGAAEGSKAFLGGTFGYAFLWGMKRSLFSNEAGQGSAPIAHSAAKTDEPIREGVVAGLEPFIDTIVVCTLTALIILSTGAWNRGAEGYYPADQLKIQVLEKTPQDDGSTELKAVAGEKTTIKDPEGADKVVYRSTFPVREKSRWAEVDFEEKGSKWTDVKRVFVIVQAQKSSDTGNSRHRLFGTVVGEDDNRRIEWEETDFTYGKNESVEEPTLEKEEDGRVALYQDFKGAALTSHAFDRVTPGLGKWLVTLAAWLFALSTVISWSYYGEQGIIYLFGPRGVMPYRLMYCGFMVLATTELLKSETELGNLSDLGTGCMLLVNLPICVIFGRKTMKAYHEYIAKLKSGEMTPNP